MEALFLILQRGHVTQPVQGGGEPFVAGFILGMDQIGRATEDRKSVV